MNCIDVWFSKAANRWLWRCEVDGFFMRRYGHCDTASEAYAEAYRAAVKVCETTP